MAQNWQTIKVRLNDKCKDARRLNKKNAAS